MDETRTKIAARTDSQKTEKPEKKPLPPERWGLFDQELLEKLQRRKVRLLMHDGSVIQGALVGYNRYTYTLLVDERVLCVNKGFVVTLEKAGGEA
jgi:small nuclear ribonucleoprotein (snRNP)-like protein